MQNSCSAFGFLAVKPETSEVHIHLGVDGVLENVFDLLYGGVALNESNTNTHYMPPDVYRKELRQAVDSANLPDFTYPKQSDARNLLISRPRMLFPGKPMNCIDENHIPLTKLDHLQRIFSGYKVCFHVLLTDHISYLFRYQKFLSAHPERARSATWQPLVNAIRSKLFTGNDLLIWNAEDFELFLTAFLENILKVPEKCWPALLDLAEPAAIDCPSVSECDSFISDNDFDQDFFDLQYEEDLNKLREI